MLTWTTIFLAMSLAAAPFALGDTVRAPTAETAFYVMLLFAALSLLCAFVAAARFAADWIHVQQAHRRAAHHR